MRRLSDCTAEKRSRVKRRQRLSRFRPESLGFGGMCCVVLSVVLYCDVLDCLQVTA